MASPSRLPMQESLNRRAIVLARCFASAATLTSHSSRLPAWCAAASVPVIALSPAAIRARAGLALCVTSMTAPPRITSRKDRRPQDTTPRKSTSLVGSRTLCQHMGIRPRQEMEIISSMHTLAPSSKTSMCRIFLMLLSTSVLRTTRMAAAMVIEWTVIRFMLASGEDVNDKDRGFRQRAPFRIYP
ncbi:hypothetical protein F5Y15DRAFT_374106 [Xylariaceae sp. FL0016]|nr:hypothetical protein F5Y15DRAFT_374106 [Xylariaceae sp. FL0016]